MFSYQRATGPGSQINAYFQSVKEVKKIDDFTVDFITKFPNPIMLEEITGWVIMSKAWCEEHNAAQPVDLTKSGENYATRHANGTGPFILDIREPDRRTTLQRQPGLVGQDARATSPKSTFNVIGNAATRVAALLSGDVDMIYTVPPQDMDRLEHDARASSCWMTPELRTIFLGFDVARPELLKSDVKGKNPFQDERVRQAFYQAIDINAIQPRVMRDQSHPTGLMYGPGVNGYDRGAGHAATLRPRGGQEAAGRGRLPERVRRHARLPERPLRQRRGDLPGGDGDAGPDRRQGQRWPRRPG